MLPLSPRTSTHVFKCSWFYVTECAVEHGLGSNLKNTMKNLKRTFWGKWFWLCRWMIRWKWTVTVAVANVKTGQFWNNFLDDFEIIDSHFATLPRSFEKKRVFMNTVSGPPGCFCRCALRSLKRPKHHLLVISHIKSKWKVWNMFSTNGRFFWNNCKPIFGNMGWLMCVMCLYECLNSCFVAISISVICSILDQERGQQTRWSSALIRWIGMNLGFLQENGSPKLFFYKKTYRRPVLFLNVLSGFELFFLILQKVPHSDYTFNTSMQCHAMPCNATNYIHLAIT